MNKTQGNALRWAKSLHFESGHTPYYVRGWIASNGMIFYQRDCPQ